MKRARQEMETFVFLTEEKIEWKRRFHAILCNKAS